MLDANVSPAENCNLTVDVAVTLVEGYIVVLDLGVEDVAFQETTGNVMDPSVVVVETKIAVVAADFIGPFETKFTQSAFLLKSVTIK